MQSQLWARRAGTESHRYFLLEQCDCSFAMDWQLQEETIQTSSNSRYAMLSYECLQRQFCIRLCHCI